MTKKKYEKFTKIAWNVCYNKFMNNSINRKYITKIYEFEVNIFYFVFSTEIFCTIIDDKFNKKESDNLFSYYIYYCKIQFNAFRIFRLRLKYYFHKINTYGKNYDTLYTSCFYIPLCSCELSRNFVVSSDVVFTTGVTIVN